MKSGRCRWLPCRVRFRFPQETGLSRMVRRRTEAVTREGLFSRAQSRCTLDVGFSAWLRSGHDALTGMHQGREVGSCR